MFRGKFKPLAAGLLAVAAAITTATATGAHAASNSSKLPLADPDTVIAKDGHYVTYGTNLGAGAGPRCGAKADTRLYVPFMVSGSGSTVGQPTCAAGDAMPGGPGSWANRSKGVWAPGVVRFGSTYYLFYAATKAGTGSSTSEGHKCIGVAHSASARGPFTGQREWACPPGGRWAIDPDPFVSGSSMYVAYRDDAITSGSETGVSVVRTSSTGSALWSTRRDALKSTDYTWDTFGSSAGTHIVENPSMFKHGTRWYLAYSGNKWDTARYSTGIASCGTSPLPASRCTPLQNGRQRPYFGYGASAIHPYRGLPGNHPGPGGMDVFTAADGTKRAVWHWYSLATHKRHVMVGTLNINSGGFAVS